MKHLGDITKIDGRTVPKVCVVIGGSPCQDLSVAGKRSGLSGERSGLFMEMIRIIKEMREDDKRNGRTGSDVRPRFMAWENVPGAFSSNKGEDFRIVLEEIVKVVSDCTVIPRPPKNKWRNTGVILGDGFSVAWRVLDAQFWGVPQRRRRIALVADFGGCAAPEILFERESLSGNSQESGTPWEGAAANLENSTGNTVWCLQGNGIDRADTAGCNGRGWRENVSFTLNTVDRPAVYDARGNGDGETVPTLTGDHLNRVTDYTAICIGNGQVDQLRVSDKVGALNCMHDQQAIISIDRAAFNQGINAQFDFEISDNGINPTLVANGPSAVSINTVRRLTPLECERLQGFPDGWTDIGEWTDSKGKAHKTSDSARYKALGNSIALPPWRYVLSGVMEHCGGEKTMASLFDGIGGFPLIWRELGGNTVWASEIEEFPIAVTKKHFN